MAIDVVSLFSGGGGLDLGSDNNKDNKCYIFKTATFPYRLT